MFLPRWKSLYVVLGAGLLLLGLAGMVIRSTTVVHASKPPRSLEPIGWFDIPTDGKSGLAGFAASNAGLHFLLVSRDGAEVVQTAADGVLKNRFLLPVTNISRSTWGMKAGPQGDVAVLHKSPTRSESFLVDSQGVIRGHMDIPRNTSDIVPVGDRVIAVDASSSSLVEIPGGKSVLSLSAPLDGPFSTLPMPDGRRIAIVESTLPRLRILDVDASTEAVFALSSSEIARAQAEELPPGVSQNIVFGPAIDSADRIVCATSYFVREGAAIAVFSDDGSLQERLRCRLPTFPDLEKNGNPEGRLLVEHVGVTENRLVIVSSRDMRCAYYPYSSEVQTAEEEDVK